jgi:hypothetical protein
MSEEIYGELDKTFSSLATGKAIRKDLQLICDENEVCDSAHATRVWHIRSNEEDEDTYSVNRRKANFFCNDDTVVTLVVICEVVITNHSNLSGLNLHTTKDGRCKKKLENVILKEKAKVDIGGLLSETLLHNGSLDVIENLSDVELVAGGKRFKAHKMILAISSKVFAKRFLARENGTIHDSIDTDNDIMAMDEFDAETVEKMIQFLYKGRLERENYISVRLLTLANRYEIIKLKHRCEAALIDTLNMESAISLWHAAKFSKATYLQGTSEEFMFDYWEKGFQNTEAFRNLNPKDGMEILSSIIAIAKGRHEQTEP